LTQNPITRVLSIFQKNDVRFLLMGGQACVLYGAAEFSRDIDVSMIRSRPRPGRHRFCAEHGDGW